ncbi:MAG: hypothetical protein IJX69_04750 [Oscillospiraceae bacterium]|nr:hypothetical protein [Oscillospiraceae bacterium]
MKKLKQRWLRIPRKQRAVVHILMIVLLSFMLYILLGCPPLTAEQRFRRVEKANLVGPSMILGTEDLSSNRLIIAEEKDAVILYSYPAAYPENDIFVYREKAGDVTVLAAPTNDMIWYYDEEAALDVIVFDDFPQATRAELDFTLAVTVNNVPFEKHYSLHAQRERDGYFLFSYTTEGNPYLTAEAPALEAFIAICGSNGDTYIDFAVPVTVRLFDEQDTLIAERSLILRSQAVEAHPGLSELTE